MILCASVVQVVLHQTAEEPQRHRDHRDVYPQISVDDSRHSVNVSMCFTYGQLDAVCQAPSSSSRKSSASTADNEVRLRIGLHQHFPAVDVDLEHDRIAVFEEQCSPANIIPLADLSRALRRGVVAPIVRFFSPRRLRRVLFERLPSPRSFVHLSISPQLWCQSN